MSNKMVKILINKEVIERATEFNRYFLSANNVDVPQKITVDRDEWRALFGVICASQVTQSEPAGYIGADNNRYQYWQPITPLYPHPAPTPTPLSREERHKVFKRAEQRIAADPNLSWRNAILEETEKMHGIKE